MKNFHLHCILRVLLIAATFLAAACIAAFWQLYVAAGIVAVVGFFQTYRLIRYVERTNRELRRFLLSIRYDDFSQRFTGSGRGASYAELAAAFTRVMDIFRRERSEKEAQHRYLEMVMQHAGVGLISYRTDGDVELINEAAKRLLRLNRLRNVEQLESAALREALMTSARKDKTVLRLTVEDDELLQLSIYVTSFVLREGRYRLASLQNIGRELEEKEVEAWQKLTRVLTHEIMNSITPISSLAGTARALLTDGDRRSGGETVDDVRAAVQTIERRSEGLLHFVDAYRRLARVPQPDYRFIPVTELFERIEQLLRNDLRRRSIRLTRDVEPESLTLTADAELIEQVLINLVKNAMEAVDADGEIRLNGYIDRRSRVVLKVIDDGAGIVPEALEKIFIPFYTTKKDGSGIGLSLSREIMRRHGGAVGARSTPDELTTFTLRF